MKACLGRNWHSKWHIQSNDSQEVFWSLEELREAFRELWQVAGSCIMSHETLEAQRQPAEEVPTCCNALNELKKALQVHLNSEDQDSYSSVGNNLRILLEAMVHSFMDTRGIPRSKDLNQEIQLIKKEAKANNHAGFLVVTSNYANALRDVANKLSECGGGCTRAKQSNAKQSNAKQSNAMVSQSLSNVIMYRP